MDQYGVRGFLAEVHVVSLERMIREEDVSVYQFSMDGSSLQSSIRLIEEAGCGRDTASSSSSVPFLTYCTKKAISEMSPLVWCRFKHL